MTEEQKMITHYVVLKRLIKEETSVEQQDYYENQVHHIHHQLLMMGNRLGYLSGINCKQCKEAFDIDLPLHLLKHTKDKDTHGCVFGHEETVEKFKEAL